jgi:hypothetical protein
MRQSGVKGTRPRGSMCEYEVGWKPIPSVIRRRSPPSQQRQAGRASQHTAVPTSLTSAKPRVPVPKSRVTSLSPNFAGRERTLWRLKSRIEDSVARGNGVLDAPQRVNRSIRQLCRRIAAQFLATWLSSLGTLAISDARHVCSVPTNRAPGQHSVHFEPCLPTGERTAERSRWAT